MVVLLDISSLPDLRARGVVSFAGIHLMCAGKSRKNTGTRYEQFYMRMEKVFSASFFRDSRRF
jgi:hypothetical protein